MEKNLYEILGISRHSSPEEIERTYKILSVKYREKFKESGNIVELEKSLSIIKNAYEILADNQKRTEYDFFLKEKEKNKKIIEENIRSINENESSEKVDDELDLSIDIELPEIEEVSQEEIENNKKIEQEKEEIKQEEVKKATKKYRVKMSVVLAAILVITIISVAAIASNEKNKPEQEAALNEQDVQSMKKEIKSGERLPEEVLNSVTDFGVLEKNTEIWLYYSEEYDIYYKKDDALGIEVYYSKKIPIEDGGLWIYEERYKLSFIYDEEYDSFIGHDSKIDKTYELYYDSYYKEIEIEDYDEEYTEIVYNTEYENVVQHSIYKEDANGNIYFINANGQFEEAQDGEYAVFTDNKGRMCYIDKVDGSRYYIDEYSGLRYYREEETNRYYFIKDNFKYYEYDIIDDCPYYRDINGNIFCREDQRTWLYDYEDMLTYLNDDY